jgi:nitroimidazol reductase NimA-like FMN-containing flavoprotein (pyridoxamine 5'-phosphate oxidase superfamily)
MANRKSPKADRPYMPGYAIMPADKGDGLFPWTWAEKRLTAARNYWLSTARPNGHPHCMPVWGVWFEGAFYFSTGGESRKARNLADCPHCVVCPEQGTEAVILEGRAQKVAVKTLQKLSALSRAYRKKYDFELDPSLGPVFKVTPKVVFGMTLKMNRNATRWTFLSAMPGSSQRSRSSTPAT